MARGARHAAKTHVLFRRANEDLCELGARLLAEEAELAAAEWPLPFLCECADATCTRVVRLTLAEFEDVRARTDRIVVLPGHEGQERAIARGGRFSIVELPAVSKIAE